MPRRGAAPATYTLDPERTTIRANVKAMFGLLTVHGTFRLRSGQVSLAPDPGASSVQASIEAGSWPRATRTGTPTSSRRPCWTPGLPGDHLLWPGRAPRRRRLGGARVGDRARDRGAAEIRLGDVRQEAGGARFLATARLDRTSFGVTKKKGMVGRTVDLVIEAVAEPA